MLLECDSYSCSSLCRLILLRLGFAWYDGADKKEALYCKAASKVGCSLLTVGIGGSGVVELAAGGIKTPAGRAAQRTVH